MLNHFLEFIGADKLVKRIVRPWWPRWRAANQQQRKEFQRILGGLHPATQFALHNYPTNRSLLLVGYAQADLVAVQAPTILAARMAGYRVSVILPGAYCASADFYRVLGVSDIVESDTLDGALPLRQARDLVSALTSPGDLLELKERGVPVGKFAASTLMRQTRSAHIDPADAALRPRLIRALATSLRAAQTARRILAKVRPELVVFYDRGYTPDGELFELALAQGARAVTTNTAHKSGYLLFKRYDLSNKDCHPAALAPATWKRLLQMQWTDAHWDALRLEIKNCYESGLWYDEVGTQFNTRMLSSRDLIASLGLDPNKPTAVVFPHLFWDATFFWGTDLFDDYRDWFVNVLREAARNPQLNWIIKIHPANIVKNRRDNYSGEYSEIQAIRESIGQLPSHMSIIAPDSPISTFSLYELMDYCLTVRGTVGLEAAVFGKQVLTAGTGRYDGLGFTLDSQSQAQYLDRLARLHTLPQPSAEQTEAARRYSFGLFLLRPLHTASMRFRYDQNERASLKTELNLPVGGRLEDCADLLILARWLAETSQDDLLGAADSVPIH